MVKLNDAEVGPIGPRQAKREFDHGIEGLGIYGLFLLC